MKETSPTHPFSAPWHENSIDHLNKFFKGGAPAPPPPPDPPATQRRTEVVTAERIARRDAKKRKGQLATLVAGETGGATLEQRSSASLLGG